MNSRPRLIVAFFLIVLLSSAILIATYLVLSAKIASRDNVPTADPSVSSTGGESNDQISTNILLSSEDLELLENPIYKRFQIKAPKQKKRVNVVIVIQSAPNGGERRQAVRDTWMKYCVETDKVQIIFIFNLFYNNSEAEIFADRFKSY